MTQANFVFHAAQAREDSLYKQLGFASLPDTQIKPQGVPIAGTTVWPTAAGNGTPPTGQTGTTTVIAWNYGTNTPLTFDPSKDKLDFGWFKAPDFDVTDTTGSTKITIVGNNQTYTLTGVTLGQLQTGNIIALDSGARTKWQNLIFTATPTTALPSLSVADRSAAEGNTGTSAMNFTVLLSKAAANTVSVGYTTSNDTATAGDFTPTVGTLSFAPGETSKIVSVAISGDSMYELNEQFTLNLSNATNATIADAAAIGIITNDDINPSPATPPKVSIADLAVTEGNGEHSHFMFTATLDKASATTVSVGYATSNGTATAGVDYTAESGTITFAPGVTTQTVHVGVIGDTAVEPNETFTVTLSAPSGVTIAKATAIGTITNDDAGRRHPPHDHTRVEHLRCLGHRAGIRRYGAGLPAHRGQSDHRLARQDGPDLRSQLVRYGVHHAGPARPVDTQLQGNDQRNGRIGIQHHPAAVLQRVAAYDCRTQWH